MKLPRITVITPSYNQGHYLRSTIESVLSQNYPNLEYIVVDGGSTDQTLKILKQYSSRLQYISEPDKGQADAINKGLCLATGDLLCYLNSDDIFLPGALRAAAECYIQTNADWITGDCLVIDAVGKPRPGGTLIRLYKRLLLKLYSRTLLMIADNMIPQPSTFWSRRAYERVGEFNEDYHYDMDYDYWLRLSRYYRPHDLGVTLAAFRAQPDSKSETSRPKLMAEGDIALRKNGATPLHLTLHRTHSWVVRLVYKSMK